MSLIHEKLTHAKSDEKVRTLVSLLQALCRADAEGGITTASSSGTGSPTAARSNYASHLIRRKSRFGGYIRGLEIKVQGCVDQGDEDETREGGLAVHSPPNLKSNNNTNVVVYSVWRHSCLRIPPK